MGTIPCNDNFIYGYYDSSVSAMKVAALMMYSAIILMPRDASLDYLFLSCFSRCDLSFLLVMYTGYSWCQSLPSILRITVWYVRYIAKPASNLS